VILGSLAAPAVVVLPSLCAADLGAYAVAFGGVLALVALLFGSLQVRIDEQGIFVRFGIGVIRRKISLSDVRTFFEVRNPWYYGWGIRLTPSGTLYNVSGLSAVELWLKNGKRLRIGTDEPAALQRALVERLGAPEAPPLDGHRASELRLRRVYVVLLAVILLPVLFVGVSFYLQLKPPTVRVSQGVLTVQSFWYDEEIALKDARVSLVEHLPRIRARTNGFALGSTLRGHFRLDELGPGQLFIEYRSPPYVLVRDPRSYVVIGFEDPQRTRRLYAELTR
jgi:hypothetical protein